MGAYEDLFGGTEKKPSAYDELFGSPDMDFSSEPMDVPATPPVTLNDAGRNKQLEEASRWYIDHYGTGDDAAKTLGGGALEYLSTILGFAPAGGAAARIGVGAASGAMGGAGGAIKEGGDSGEVALSTLLGGILGGAPDAIGAVASKAGNWLSQLGSDARNYVLGGAAEIADIARTHGFEDVTANMGDLLKQHSPSGLLGKPLKEHLGNVSAAKDVAGHNLRQLRGEINTHLAPPTEGAGSLMPGTPGDIDLARKKLLQDLVGQTEGLGQYADAGSDAKAAALQRIASRYADTPGSYTPGRAGPRVGEEFTVDDLAADSIAAAEAQRAELQALGINPGVMAGGSPSSPGPFIGREFETDYLPGDTQAAAEALKSKIDLLGINPRLYGAATGGSPPGQIGQEFTTAVLSAEGRAAAAAQKAELDALGLNPDVFAGGQPGVSAPGSAGMRFRDYEQLGDVKARYADFARPNGQETVSDDATKWAAGQAASSLKRSEDELAKLAPENIQRSFGNQKERYGELALLETLLEKRMPAELTKGDVGGIVASSLMSAVPGALAGYGAAQATGQSEMGGMLGGAGAAVGAGLGFMGGQGATRTAARQWMGRRGSEIGANVLEAAGAGMGSAGNAAARTRPLGVFGAQSAGEAIGEDRSRGHDAVRVVEDALKTNPQLLGPYAERLANAEDKQIEITVLIDEDPQFRQLMRQLSAGAR